MDVALLIAVIGMVAGICSPIIVVVIQGLFSLKESKLRAAYDQKSPVYKEFAELYGLFYKHSANESRKAFVGAAWSAALICDKKSRRLILDFLKRFEDENDVTSQSMDKQFFECLESLNDDLARTMRLLPFFRINR